MITDDKVRELLSELTTTYDVANKLCDNHHNIIKVCQSLLASREEVKELKASNEWYRQERDALTKETP